MGGPTPPELEDSAHGDRVNFFVYFFLKSLDAQVQLFPDPGWIDGDVPINPVSYSKFHFH